MAARIAIVVVNWNGREDTLACLASLRGVEYSPLDVVVVDNGSSDGSVPAIRAAFPEVRLIEAGRNLGFAGGNNVGIEAALAEGADYVLLLNNDTVVSPDLVRELVTVAQASPDVAAVSPKIYYQTEPERVWYAGARWVPERATFEHVGQDTVDDGDHGDGQPRAPPCGTRSRHRSAAGGARSTRTSTCAPPIRRLPARHPFVALVL